MDRPLVLALAIFIGVVLFLGVFFVARFFTGLPDLVILGSELTIIFLFAMIRAFVGPLAKRKALRNVGIVRALPLGLFALGALLGACKKTSYAWVLVVAAGVVHFTIGKRSIRKLRNQIREEQAKDQPNS